MAANVAEDAAIPGPLKKPGGARRLAQPVRAEADDLDHAANGAAVHEVPGVDGALHVQALTVVDHVFAPGAGADGPCLVELVERGERRLVGEIVFVRLHHPAAEGTTVAGHGGSRD